MFSSKFPFVGRVGTFLAKFSTGSNMLFLGTMGTPMVPKIIWVEKYAIWAFKRRVERLYTIPECVCTIL